MGPLHFGLPFPKCPKAVSMAGEDVLGEMYGVFVRVLKIKRDIHY